MYSGATSQGKIPLSPFAIYVAQTATSWPSRSPYETSVYDSLILNRLSSKFLQR
jgi:hypothetical protein